MTMSLMVNMRLGDRQESMMSLIDTMRSALKVPAAVMKFRCGHLSPERPNMLAGSHLMSLSLIQH